MSLTLEDVALDITHLLEKNLVTTYDAEKILWTRSLYLYELNADIAGKNVFIPDGVIGYEKCKEIIDFFTGTVS